MSAAPAKGQAGAEPPAQRRVLKVIATDAGSQRDFRAFAQLAGHELLREEAAEGVYRYWLRKR